MRGGDPYSRTQITQITAGFSPIDHHAEWLSRACGASVVFFQKTVHHEISGWGGGEWVSRGELFPLRGSIRPSTDSHRFQGFPPMDPASMEIQPCVGRPVVVLQKLPELRLRGRSGVHRDVSVEILVIGGNRWTAVWIPTARRRSLRTSEFGRGRLSPEIPG